MNPRRFTSTYFAQFVRWSCPTPALGYREDENRIGARVRDWVVGLPDLGFVYPAFANRGSDVNAVMYYVKTGKSSHPELVEQVLGCVPQRTAAEDKQAFRSVVLDAFGDDEGASGRRLFPDSENHQRHGSPSGRRTSPLPPVSLTAETLSGLATDAEVPDKIREQIEKSYAHVFGDTPPVADNVLDNKLVEEGTARAHTAALEQKGSGFAAGAGSTGARSAPMRKRMRRGMRMPRSSCMCRRSGQAASRADMVDGQKCLLIPLEEGGTRTH